MASSERVQLLTCVILGLAAGLGVIYAAPSVSFQAKGIVLPAKKVRPATQADSIQMLSTLPVGAVRLGTIRISRHAKTQTKQAEEEIVNNAKALAAKVGANAIVVKQFYRSRPSGLTAALAAYGFTGIAVYVPRLSASLMLPPISIQYQDIDGGQG